SLVLLLVLGCGLIAGPHPCQAQATAPAPEAAEAAVDQGCHSHEPASPVANTAANTAAGPSVSSGSGEEDCCAGRHNALCQAACQSVAIVGAGTHAFAVLPSVQAEAATFEPALSPFAHGIDHIPLG
ncbi:MAG TPA: hypothetical protein VLT87_16415, partial [Thermoanaerobaculia bacterium]|nr:hypothetical protein [Thermoanaerobaculia bacterium]